MPEPDRSFRVLLSEVLARCGRKRPEVARAMTERLGVSITVSKLNDYTATTKMGARFPASYVAAFCEATGDDRLLRFLLDPRLQAVIDLGKHTLEAVRDNKQAIDDLIETERRTGRRVRL